MAVLPKITYPSGQRWINPSESFMGTGEPNTQLTYTAGADGFQPDLIQVDENGNWSFHPTPHAIPTFEVWTSDKVNRAYYINEPTNYVMAYDASVAIQQPAAPTVPATGTAGTAFNVNVGVAGTISVYLNGVLQSPTISAVAGDNSFAPSVAGNYTFSLTDANGNISTVSSTVVVAPKTVVLPAAPTVPASGTTGTAFNVNTAVAGTLKVYLNGNLQPTTLTAIAGDNSFTPTTAGSYTFTVTDTNGNTSALSTITTVTDAASSMCPVPTQATITQSQSVMVGSQLTLGITVNGSATNYTLYKKGVAGTGGLTTPDSTIASYTTNQNYTFTYADTDKGTYYWIVENACQGGTKSQMRSDDIVITTGTGTPTNCATPVITAQPNDSTTTDGTGYITSSVNVAAPSDGGTLSYQWQFQAKGASSFVNVPGQTTPNLSVPSAVANAGTYRVIITNTCGNTPTPVTSATMIATVNPAPAATYVDLVVNSISTNLATIKDGDNVIISAEVQNNGTGATPDGVINGVRFDIDGVTVGWSDTYTKSLAPGEKVTLQMNAGQSWTAVAGIHTILAEANDVVPRRITESDYTNNTKTLSITVNANTSGSCATPGVSISANAITVALGGIISLTAYITGANTGIQWKKDGVAIPGATSTTFTKANITASDYGTYTVEATNACSGLTASIGTAEIAITGTTPPATVVYTVPIGVMSGTTFTAGDPCPTSSKSYGYHPTSTNVNDVTNWQSSPDFSLTPGATYNFFIKEDNTNPVNYKVNTQTIPLV